MKSLRPMKRKDTEGRDDAVARDKKSRKPCQDSSPPPKSGHDAIDSIFSKKKSKLSSNDQASHQNKGTKRRKTCHSSAERSFSHSAKEWVDDGLGGKFNQEGFTGRIEDGVKIFKAHVLNQPKAGTTKDCPFDCSCCFI